MAITCASSPSVQAPPTTSGDARARSANKVAPPSPPPPPRVRPGISETPSASISSPTTTTPGADGGGTAAAALVPDAASAAPPPLPTMWRGLRDACKEAGLSSNGVEKVLLKRLQDNAAGAERPRSPPRAPPSDSLPSSRPPVAAQPGTGLTAALAASVLRAQAPPFSKNEFGRLFHVMAMAELAEAIVKSRGPLTR